MTSRLESIRLQIKVWWFIQPKQCLERFEKGEVKMKLKGVFLVLVIFLIGCSAITGGVIVESDETFSTDEPTHYYLVERLVMADFFVSITTSALSSIIVTTKGGCEHYVRTKSIDEQLVLEKFDLIKEMIFDTKKALGTNEFCFVIINEEAPGTNEIRARVYY